MACCAIGIAILAQIYVFVEVVARRFTPARQSASKRTSAAEWRSHPAEAGTPRSGSSVAAALVMPRRPILIVAITVGAIFFGTLGVTISARESAQPSTLRTLLEMPTNWCAGSVYGADPS